MNVLRSLWGSSVVEGYFTQERNNTLSAMRAGINAHVTVKGSIITHATLAVSYYCIRSSISYPPALQ